MVSPERTAQHRRRNISCAGHGFSTLHGGSASPIRSRPTNGICIAIRRRSSAIVSTTRLTRPSAGRYTAIQAGRRRWAGFTRPVDFGAVAVTGSRPRPFGASSMPSSIPTTTRALPVAKGTQRTGKGMGAVQLRQSAVSHKAMWWRSGGQTAFVRKAITAGQG